MKVTAVTPSDSASDPLHPDHDRWVKEMTLKMEVEHAKRLGRSTRDAETENAYWLQRAEAKARERPSVAAPSGQQRKRKTRDERLAERPVTRKFVGPEKTKTFKDISPCGRCGLCRACKREKRIYYMALLYRVHRDPKIKEILDALWMTSLHAKNLTGPFFGWTVRDANRALTQRLEDICDSTVPTMGDWK